MICISVDVYKFLNWECSIEGPGKNLLCYEIMLQNTVGLELVYINALGNAQ